MGYLPPAMPPPRLNVDRHGMPLDYASYVWLLYRRHVRDDSPVRRAFLHVPTDIDPRYPPNDFGVQEMMR